MPNSCDALHVTGSRAAVDDTAWDGGEAMSNCASKDDPAPCYGAICAGQKAGDDSKQSSWALPHHKAPGDPPNAAAVRNALARLPQTQGLTNRAAAEAHLQAHMKAISPDANALPTHGEIRAAGVFDPDGDGDDDSSPETDTDHDFWDEDGEPIMEAWLAAGASPPVAGTDEPDEVEVSPGVMTSVGYGPNGTASAHSREMAVRAQATGMEWREVADSPMGQLYGIFSEFNSWYPVSSAWEGEFIERVLPGAFTDTIKNDRPSMRVLYDHGQDPSIGNKPLGRISALREEPNGPYYEVDLFETDYNREQIVPLLRGLLMNGQTTGSALGSSFRFQVQDDNWNMKPKPSKFNPQGLPQRSIVKAKVFEFGPVTFPANAGATAAARSMTDQWLAKLVAQRRDDIPANLRRLAREVTPEILEAAQREERMRLQDKLRRQARALLAISG